MERNSLVLAKVTSCAVVGLEGVLIEVEVDITNGLPAFNIVGLPDTAVQEAKERVRSAIKNTGMPFPRTRITVNLAPADIRKAGPAYDLPIAVGILLAQEAIYGEIDGAIFMGELSLDGSVRHVSGVLPMANLAQRAGHTTLFVPEQDAPEAALVEGVDVYPLKTLLQLVDHLTGHQRIALCESNHVVEVGEPEVLTDFSQVKGQEHVKRAAEVAAAGAHNMLLSGPPGSGKTLIARAMPGILPPLELEEAMDISRL
jgi:magnesium chelatase family protein